MSLLRILTLTLAVALTLSISGCGSSAGTESSTGSDAPTSASPSTDETAESELIIEDLTVGEGAEATVGSTATVHYTGWLTDGSEFDSSKNYGKPFEFTIGAGEVIAGWEQGVQGMKVGGVRKLTIPSELGYGAQGAGGGLIPPNATLVFEVELLEVR